MEIYEALVAERKACRLCGNSMLNPSTLSRGQYDSDEIGAWPLWLGDRKAKVMIIGKDWGTKNDFLLKNKSKPIGKDDPNNSTNKRLIELVKLLGIEVFDCSQGQNTKAGIFLTNAVLCMKNTTSRSAYVRKAYFKNCQSLLLQTIETIDPTFIISLGEDAFKAVLAAYEQSLLPYKRPYRDIVERRSHISLGKRYLFPVCHTSIAHINRRSSKINDDWLAIREQMKAIEAA